MPKQAMRQTITPTSSYNNKAILDCHCEIFTLGNSPVIVNEAVYTAR